MFTTYLERFLSFLKEEINEIKLELNSEEEHFGKPVVKENKAAEQYLLLLTKTQSYIEKETKNGEYKPEDWKSINRKKMELSDLATKELGTEDWKKYIIIFWSGKSREFATMTTNYGRKIWRKKDETGVRNPEGQKAKEYWHKLQIVLYEFKKRVEEDNFTNPTEAS
ncbi:hypothetical protein A6V39_05760 [Candidatus Mycoplasma haematobovis]|uniref:Uncharacterized protein n=1 Tax=Candidatus Mycoplasma haematobovis TaxID=432608 RepID=A0A1A9QF76_9MOLU|nr:hypothetical protein [Candidatus Mycoplasma haematobovis]OAL10794.1 hypothetical protein A6V39_05760 [Candidatus Mycoplasma haematobovis]